MSSNQLTEKGKVSIILPIYNQEHFLDKSMNAILSQTYSNIEIIAVNDGSTDGSLEIIKSYQKKDTRVVLVEKPNGGLVDAVYTGVQHASGEWIAFVDPDDYVSKEYISNLISLTDEATDFVAAGIDIQVYNQETVVAKREVFLDETKIFFEEAISQLKEDYFWDKKSAAHKQPVYQSRCNKLYKREIVKNAVQQYGKYKKASMGEDTLFNYLVLREDISKIVAYKEPLGYTYCLRKDSSMTRNTDFHNIYHKYGSTFESFIEILDKHEDSHDMAYELYFEQIQFLLAELVDSPIKYRSFQSEVRRDKHYRESYDIIYRNAIGKARIKLIIKKFIELNTPIELSLMLMKIRCKIGRMRG